MTFRKIGDCFDWSKLEQRAIDHYIRRGLKRLPGVTGTITGRITNHRPNFKDIEPMKEQTLYLSKFLFELGKKGPEPYVTRSPLTNKLAQTLADDQDKVLELATLLARLHGLSFEGGVTGFVVTRDSDDSPFGSLSELMKAVADAPDPRPTPEIIPTHEQQLMTSKGLCATVLWARAAMWLEGESDHDVEDFEEDCIELSTGEKRPGIRGEDITIEVVNGALMQVLVDEGLSDHMGELSKCMATKIDYDGWVFSSCAGPDD